MQSLWLTCCCLTMCVSLVLGMAPRLGLVALASETARSRLVVVGAASSPDCGLLLLLFGPKFHLEAAGLARLLLW